MVLFLILLVLILLTIVMIQIGKVGLLGAQIKGEQEANLESSRFHGTFGLFFMIGLLVLTCYTAWSYSDVMIFGGFSPVKPASEHAHHVNNLIRITLILTGFVFIVTHIFLYWYAFRFREKKGSKAVYWPHNNKLEVLWMAIPAVAMTVLIVYGMVVWNKYMFDLPKDAVVGKDYIEIEAMGQQFNWVIRYPGKDMQLGSRDFTKISGTNPMGQDWDDVRNHDDFQPNEIVLPVGMPCRVRITAKDVLHNFYLPQFQVKMDAVPGMPTYFIFKPTITTDSMRTMLSKSAQYNEPDKADPTKKRWETFDYELACAELCGTGHFSMRRVVKIVSNEEYQKWYNEQQSLYDQSVKGK